VYPPKVLLVALALVVAVAVTQLSILLTTVYLHRALAHRALRLSPAVTVVCRVLVWTTTGIRPRQWVAVHRKHHAFTDVEGDPHSPLIEGFAAVQFGNVLLYRKGARDPAIVDRYARDVVADRWDRVLFDHAILGLGLGVGLLYVVFGPWIALLVAVVHTSSYLLLNSAINAVGHWRGSQPHDNTARNNQWLAWITSGEGLHNNHHAAPTSARLALRRGEVDPGWWLVWFLERRGWATVRHHEVRLKVPAAV
jgi:stearoyl-CoA desaturase (delta-9 desaturase)